VPGVVVVIADVLVVVLVLVSRDVVIEEPGQLTVGIDVSVGANDGEPVVVKRVCSGG
jgi:hypothetical protein